MNWLKDWFKKLSRRVAFVPGDVVFLMDYEVKLSDDQMSKALKRAARGGLMGAPSTVHFTKARAIVLVTNTNTADVLLQGSIDTGTMIARDVPVNHLVFDHHLSTEQLLTHSAEEVRSIAVDRLATKQRKGK